MSPAAKRIAREEATVRRVHAAAVDAQKALAGARMKGGARFVEIDGETDAWALSLETPAAIEASRKKKLAESKRFHEGEPEVLEQDLRAENVVHDLAHELRILLADAGKGAEEPEAAEAEARRLAEDLDADGIAQSLRRELQWIASAKKMRRILDAALGRIAEEDRAEIEERVRALVFGE